MAYSSSTDGELEDRMERGHLTDQSAGCIGPRNSNQRRQQNIFCAMLHKHRPNFRLLYFIMAALTSLIVLLFAIGALLGFKFDLPESIQITLFSLLTASMTFWFRPPSIAHGDYDEHSHSH